MPPDASKNGWCYDAALADPRTHVFYLADTANKRITVINPASKAVGGIGTGQFTGIGKCHQGNFDAEGPNGLVITGGDIYAGNGNSHVLGYSLRTGRLIANYNTGGKLQAGGLAAVGCGGPAQVILNVRTGHQTPVSFLGSDLVAASGSDFFFISYILNKLIVVDASGKILQAFATAGASHTVAVAPCTGDVWVPEDKGDVNVYAPVR